VHMASLVLGLAMLGMFQGERLCWAVAAELELAEKVTANQHIFFPRIPCWASGILDRGVREKPMFSAIKAEGEIVEWNSTDTEANWEPVSKCLF